MRSTLSRTPRQWAGGRLAALAWFVLASVLLGPLSAGAQEDEAPEGTGSAPGDGPAYPVSEFDVFYREPHDHQPPLESILPLEVQLHATPSGLAAPRPGEPSVPVTITGGPQPTRLYHASAIGHIARGLLHALHEEGLLGVYVRPSDEDIDIQTEQDLRAPGNERLRIAIWVGRIQDTRTFATGERVTSDWKVDNPIHRRIRRNSPLHEPAAGYEDTIDVLDRQALENYLYRLNRHPGRHVEAALAASEDGEGITLDYRIFESKPWNVYGQASNTGTPRTSLWQGRAGYINRQLTNNDDILSIEYMNSGGRSVNAVRVSYDAPWFGKHRPVWMESTGKEPRWMRWADRSRVPWWGADRLRWRIQGSYSRYEANTIVDIPNALGGIGQFNRILSQDWSAGARIAYNLVQYKNLFLDLYALGHFRGVKVDNSALGNQGDVTLFLPQVGLELERINQYSAVLGRFGAEYALPLGSPDEYEPAFQALGRPATDSRWWVLYWDVGVSHFLEPLLYPKAWRDPSTPRTSTLSHELSLGLRGQYAFDYRLIPQVSQIVGGQYSVRGFEQAVAVGDSVFIGSLEYRFHIPRMLPIRRKPLDLPVIGDFRVTPQQPYGRPDWDLVFRAFIDVGKSVRNDRLAGNSTELNQDLVGVGVGLEFIFKGRLRARVDWGRGIYQSIDCHEVLPDPDTQLPTAQNSCILAKQAEPNPAGELHFLFSLMY